MARDGDGLPVSVTPPPLLSAGIRSCGRATWNCATCWPTAPRSGRSTSRRWHRERWVKEKHALIIHQHNPADIKVPAAAPTLSAQVGDSQILITKTKLLPLLLFLLCTPIHAPLIGNSPPLLRYCLTVTGMPFHRTRVRCPKPTKAAIFDSFVIFFPHNRSVSMHISTCSLSNDAVSCAEVVRRLVLLKA